MKALQIGVGAAISAVALFLAFRGLDAGSVGRAFLGANYLWLALSLLLVGGSILVRALRWQALFPAGQRLGLGNLFGVLNVGYSVNNVLPLRAGEVVRAVMLGQVEPVGRLEAFSTIVVERVVDTLGVILLVIVVMPLVHIGAGAARPVLLLCVAMVGLAVVMALAATHRDAALAVSERCARLLPQRLRRPALRQAESVIAGLACFSSGRAAAQVALLTVLVYGLLVGAMQAQVAAFHLHLPPAGPFFLLGVATLGLVVPASPGAIGVWEGVVIATLTGIFAVERGAATSLALVSHVVFFAPPMLLAAIYLWRLRIPWTALFGIAREAPSPGIGD